jgi:WD40 repeat protein
MPEVFISYSRVDHAFVLALVDELRKAGRSVWVDLDGIRPTTEWLKEIFAAIDAANDVIFVLSPEAASSRFCGLELDHAAKRGKRLIPLLLRPVVSVPPALAPIQWIDFTDEARRQQSFHALTVALDTDHVWVEGHTRFLARALEWEGRGRRRSQLLRGRDLREAELWLKSAPNTPLPQILPLHHAFIQSSRRGATERSALGGAAVVGVVLLAAAGTTFYLRVAPVNEAELLCSTAAPGHRSGGLDALERASWVRADAVIRRQYTRCLNIGELTALAERAPDEPAMSVRVPTWLARSSSRVALYFTDSPSAVAAAVLATDIVGRFELAVFDRNTGRELARLKIQAEGIAGLAVAPDGTSVAVNIKDTTGQKVVIWRPRNTGEWAAAHELELDQVTMWRSAAPARVAFSNDGRFLAAASFAGMAKVWDASSLDRHDAAMVMSRRVDIDEAMGVALAPDGEWLATLGRDGTLKVFAVATGSEVAVATRPRFAAGGRLESFAWRDASTIDADSHRWRFARPEQRSFWFHPGPRYGRGARSVAFTRDERFAAIGLFSAPNLPVLNLEHPGTTLLLKGAHSEVAFSSDGTKLRAVDLSEAATFSFPGGEKLQQRDATRGLKAVATAPTGGFIAAGLQHTLTLEIEALGETPATSVMPLGHGTLLSEAPPALSSDGKRVALGFTIASGDASRIVDTRTGNVIDGADVKGDHYVFQGDTALAIEDVDGAIRNLQTKATIPFDQRTEYEANRIAFSADGTRMGDTAPNGDLRIFDLTTGALQRRLPREGRPLHDYKAFSPSSRFIAANDGDALTVWDLVTGTIAGRLKSTAILFAFDPLPDENQLRILLEDGTLQLWATTDDKPKLIAKLADLPSESLSPQYWIVDKVSAVIQSGSYNLDSTLTETRAWDLRTGKRLPHLESSKVFQVVSNDGHRRARITEQTKLRVWTEEAAEGFEVPLADDKAEAGRMRLSNDGKYLLVAESNRVDDKTKVRLIDLAQRREAASWTVASSPNCLAVSPDAKYVAVCAAGSIQFFEVGKDIPPLALAKDGVAPAVAVAFDAANDLWGVGYENGEIMVSRAGTGEELLRLSTGSERMTTIGISDMGRWLVAADAKGGIFVWNLGRLRAEMRNKKMKW